MRSDTLPVIPRGGNLFRRFAIALADDRAQLRVDADRYSLIVSDLHRLFLAGLLGALRITLDTPFQANR
jgi:hypothetical protein